MFVELFLTKLNFETVVLIGLTAAIAGALFRDRYDYTFPMAFSASLVLGLMLRIGMTNIIPSIWSTIDLAQPVTLISGVIYNMLIAMFAANMGRMVFTRKFAV